MGRGVSRATMRWFLLLEKKKVLVMEAAIRPRGGDFPYEVCTKVSLVHRRDQFRASKIMQDRAMANPKIASLGYGWTRCWVDPVVRECAQKFEDRRVYRDESDGVFVAIGHEPNTKLFAGQLKWMIAVFHTKETTETSVRGVCAGDVRTPAYRQASPRRNRLHAAMDAEKYLEHMSTEVRKDFFEMQTAVSSWCHWNRET